MLIRLTYPIKRFKVPSSHRHPDTSERIYYSVYLFSDNSLECDCIAGSYHKHCKHKARVRDYLAQKKDEEKNK